MDTKERLGKMNRKSKKEDPIKELKNIILLKELEEPYVLLKPLELIIKVYVGDEYIGREYEGMIELSHTFPVPKESINKVIPYRNLNTKGIGKTLEMAIDNFKCRLIYEYELYKKDKKELGPPTKAQLNYLETIIAKKGNKK